MSRKLKFSKQDIALLAIAALIGGPGTARVLLSLVNRYVSQYFRDRFPYDFELEHFRNILSRLRRDGLVARDGLRLWKITKRGRETADFLEKYRVYEQFKLRNRRKQPNTIITFDVPELERKKRDYLRLELIALGYTRIQKSVWIGHSPLPKEFLDYVRDLRLARHLHVFTVRDYGTLA